MKYYIATKLENWKSHNMIRDWLTKLGLEISYDWTLHGSVRDCGLDRIREVALLEHNGIIDSDIVIMLWPGGRGTHVELGMAIALDKNIILMSEIENHHIASQETSAFYHHKNVKMVRNYDEIIDLVKLANGNIR